jgi:hypothetical protein
VSIIAAQPHIGFQELYDAGIVLGNGTPEERATATEMLSTWKETHERLQKELMALSGRTRYRLLECGHDIQVVEPAVVVEEVVWVLNGGVEGGKKE